MLLRLVTLPAEKARSCLRSTQRDAATPAMIAQKAEVMPSMLNGVEATMKPT